MLFGHMFLLMSNHKLQYGHWIAVDTTPRITVATVHLLIFVLCSSTLPMKRFRHCERSKPQDLNVYGAFTILRAVSALRSRANQRGHNAWLSIIVNCTTY